MPFLERLKLIQSGRLQFNQERYEIAGERGEANVHQRLQKFARRHSAELSMFPSARIPVPSGKAA